MERALSPCGLFADVRPLAWAGMRRTFGAAKVNACGTLFWAKFSKVQPSLRDFSLSFSAASKRLALTESLAFGPFVLARNDMAATLSCQERPTDFNAVTWG
jgi:hypothetical protein